jgi:AcrR family transcriptional regulator
MTKRLPGRPKKQDKEDRRDLILNSAIRLFAENGFEAVRIKDVATESGIATSLIHHYFCNRDGLRAACRDYVILEIQNALLNLDDALTEHKGDGGTTSPDALLDTLGTVLRHSFGQRTYLIRFLAITFMEGRPETRALFQDYFATFHKITERMAASGHLRKDIDPTWVTMYGVYVQLGTAFLFDVLNAHESGDPYDPETSRSRTEAFIKIAKAGIFKPIG